MIGLWQKVSYWSIRLLITTLGLLPWGWRKQIGFLLGKAFARFPSQNRKITALQLDLFLPEQGGRKLLPLVYGNIGRTVLESVNLTPVLSGQVDQIVCQDQPILDLIRQPDRGVVALTAHLGNWDLLAAYLIKLGVPLVPIGRTARSAALQRLLTELRGSYGINTIWRAGSNELREIIDCLQQKKVVAALVDQDTRVSTIRVPFIGRAASTPIAMVKLAKRYNCAIMSGFLVREGLKGYKVFMYQLDDQDTPDKIMLQFHQQLEDLIRRYPCQWAWIHKRWRTIAEGRRLSSREYISWLEAQLSGRK